MAIHNLLTVEANHYNRVAWKANSLWRCIFRIEAVPPEFRLATNWRVYCNICIVTKNLKYYTWILDFSLQNQTYIKIKKLQEGTVSTYWCPGPTNILFWRIWIWVSWGFDIIRNFCDDFGFRWTLRTVIFNHQVQSSFSFLSNTLNTHSGALIRQFIAEDFRADRIEGLEEAAASLGIHHIHPNKVSAFRLSAAKFFAILENIFPFFVKFWRFPLKL